MGPPAGGQPVQEGVGCERNAHQAVEYLSARRFREPCTDLPSTGQPLVVDAPSDHGGGDQSADDEYPEQHLPRVDWPSRRLEETEELYHRRYRAAENHSPSDDRHESSCPFISRRAVLTLHALHPSIEVCRNRCSGAVSFRYGRVLRVRVGSGSAGRSAGGGRRRSLCRSRSVRWSATPIPGSRCGAVRPSSAMAPPSRVVG